MNRYSKRRRAFKVTLDVPEECTEEQIIAWIKLVIETGKWTGDPEYPPARDNIFVRRAAKPYQ